MKIIVAKDYSAFSQYAADVVQQYLAENPCTLVSFPGGETPVGMLEEFVCRVNSGIIDPTNVSFAQLDDWVGISPNEEGSGAFFLQTHLFEKMNKGFSSLCTFDGSQADIDQQLRDMDAFIEKHGGLGLSVLGIGMNGHLGFNENGVDFSLRCHRTPLSPVTLSVQKKYFNGQEVSFTEGITQGIAQIMEANTVVLLANGAKKAEIISKALTGPVTNDVPASILQQHPNCLCILDEDAASLLPAEFVTRL